MSSHYHRVKVFFLCWVVISFPVETIASASGDKGIYSVKYIPLSKIYLTFSHDFPWQKAWKEKVFSGCQLMLKPVVPGVTGAAHPVMRCLEKVMFLRPKTFADNWEKQQKEQGYVTLNFPEFGLTAIQAHITAITPSVMDVNGINSAHNHKSFITSIFIRHVLDVRQYTFKNIKGTHDKINVTPEHLFYVKNKHAFMPVSQISMHDRLITDTGDKVRLACHKKRQDRCSQSYASGQIKPVYNLEVYNKNTYFVGKLNLLVHNYKLVRALQKKIDDLIKTDKAGDAYLHLTTDEELQRTILAFNDINFLHTDVKAALAASRVTSIPLSVEKIQPILELHVERYMGESGPEAELAWRRRYKSCMADLFSVFGIFSQKTLTWETLHTIFNSPEDKYAVLCANERWFIIEKKGIDQYLFSSFAKDGSMSMHNASYEDMVHIMTHMTITKTVVK